MFKPNYFNCYIGNTSPIYATDLNIVGHAQTIEFRQAYSYWTRGWAAPMMRRDGGKWESVDPRGILTLGKPEKGISFAIWRIHNYFTRLRNIETKERIWDLPPSVPPKTTKFVKNTALGISLRYSVFYFKMTRRITDIHGAA